MRGLSTTHVGVIMGVGAYTFWGVLPLYLKALLPLSASTILAHRIMWSLLLLALIAIAYRRGAAALAAIRHPRIALALIFSTLLIAANWLLYIHMVNTGHAIQGSLGYFINPLLNVVLGMIFLRERLGMAETIAVLLAAAGVVALAVEQQTIPVMPLALALSFGLYGLVRKMIGIAPIEGLLIETLLLAPFALGWLLFASPPSVGLGPMPPLWLLALSGVMTTLPLLLFNGAAQRIRYSDLGLLQYIAPSIALLIAVYVFGEPLLPIHFVTFGLIWSGLLVYAVATWHRGRVIPMVPE